MKVDAVMSPRWERIGGCRALPFSVHGMSGRWEGEGLPGLWRNDGGSRLGDDMGLCCVAVECLGLAKVGVDVGLLGDDVSCRGRIGSRDGQGLPIAVLCCRGSAGLG